MCGISVLFDGKKNPLEQCMQMNDLIIHRGPDDTGYVSIEIGSKRTHQHITANSTQNNIAGSYIVLGHQRLSIIDLSKAGHQPMSAETERFWIVFNGEIYNYLSLKEELKNLGVIFYTNTDTEVLLKAYIQWGTSCLNRLNGMFAFVIYDSLKMEFFACRDRFSIKPLYYWRISKYRFAIASEIKQFSVLPEWKATINKQRAYDYLIWGHLDHSDETFFNEIKQLRGGEFLQFNTFSYQFHIKRWYTLPIIQYEGSFEEASKTFRELLSDSVSLRLKADVDVGSCLSGGLDSSSIVCLVNQILRPSKHLQKTFTAGSSLKEIDERNYAQCVAEHCSIKSYQTLPSINTLFEELESLLWFQDEPFCSTSIYAQWCVFKMAKESGVKVMLDGQGADEQLGGYHGFFKHYCSDLIRSLQLIKFFQEYREIKKIHNSSINNRILIGQFIPKSLRRLIRKLIYTKKTEISLINTGMYPYNSVHPYENEAMGSFNVQRYAQITSSNLPALLHYEDRNSMAHSIEARVPFLDYRIVEYIMSLPPSFLIQKGMTKAVLREGMKTILPDRIRLRVDKIAFATAEELWMKEHKSTFLKLANQSIEGSSGILKPSGLRYINRIVNGEIPYNQLAWRFICLGLWMRRFNVTT